MMKNRYKAIFIFFLTLGLCAIPRYVFADINDPTLDIAADVLQKILNIVIGVVGVVFAGYLIYGAWKASMALGDPKGLEGAKQAWTNAIIGIVIVVSAVTILEVITGFLSVRGAGGAIENIKSSINTLLNSTSTGDTSNSGSDNNNNENPGHLPQCNGTTITENCWNFSD